MPEIVRRPVDESLRAQLEASGCDPRLIRLYAARGVANDAPLLRHTTETRGHGQGQQRHHEDDERQ